MLLPKRRKGQAAVEYMLLVMVSVSVFGLLFWYLRQDIFFLWVCEIGPRVQSPIPCKDRNECFARIRQYTTPVGKDQVTKQKGVCDAMAQ